jgi:hypothetical protein
MTAEELNWDVGDWSWQVAALRLINAARHKFERKLSSALKELQIKILYTERHFHNST